MSSRPQARKLRSSEMDTSVCLSVLDHIHTSFTSLGVDVEINFTGGDPLLRRDIKELIAHATEIGMTVGVLGNPGLLTEERASELKNAGLQAYQVSIDGMEQTHDRIRGKKGAFRSAVRAIRLLNKTQIKTKVMFTLNRINANELIQVIELVTREQVDVFAFARTVPIGAASLEMSTFAPAEYRELLIQVDAIYSALEAQGVKTHFSRKDNLWRLLHWELGKFDPQIINDGIVRGGCSVGYKSLSILPEGIVYACPRLPIPIGDIHTQSILDIFLESDTLEKLRRIEQHEKCSSCPLLLYCRGCPAMAYAVKGDYFAGDPQCWRLIEE
ncbi:MAG: radical SAM protein [Actinomycetia bacterium]|nr:radical SAM protein [Actinomycetes bacterium]